MPYYCTVPRCTSMAGKAKNVSFHQFPRDEELAKLWNSILKRGKPYTKYSKVCSLHFKPEDYTITSVGKNKGQWRTLRKDAVPSQNLPSESPAPYTRRSTVCWVREQPSLVDPLVQQQMAQAIYMQTMLAMQTAGVTEPLAPTDQHLQTPEPIQPSPSGSSLSEIELLLRRDTETIPKEVTYKCQECTKCFKDPDVFLIHKRTHKNDTNNVEKENYTTNIQDRDETLRANPILANLLKTSMRLGPENILSVENQIMTALASNMEAYIRTLTSMISSQGHQVETSEDRRDESDYEDETEDGNEMCRDEVDGDGNDNDAANDCKFESSSVKDDTSMCVDTNDHDTHMDEVRDDINGNKSDVDEELDSDSNERFRAETVTCEDRSNISLDGNHKYTANETCIKDNDSEHETQEANNYNRNHRNATDYEKVDNKTRAEVYTSIDQNHKYVNDVQEDEKSAEAYEHENQNHANADEIDDNTRKSFKNNDDETVDDSLVAENHKYESDDKIEDNQVTKDENLYEDNDFNKYGKLVQANPDCDSIVDNVASNC